MNRPQRGIGTTSKILILILVGLTGLEFTGSFFILLFAPIIVYYVWGNYSKTKDLERRLAALEKLNPPSKKEGTADQPSEAKSPSAE